MTGLPNSGSTANSTRVPNIAIIGMEGSGKTVLTTALAKRLSTIDARGVFLNPQGIKTLRYVEGVWHTLQGGDWPPSTPPGELFELRWKYQIVGELECDVRLVDAAGQDLRMLFGDEQILSVDLLPSHLRALAEYCRAADIILFLINLKDFVGQGNPAQRTANEAAIKSAMDYLGGDGRPRRVCLVLTQTDLYRELAHERGGWLELAAEAVPYVFGAHIRVHQVAVHPVSAVADTQVVVDRDGTPRRVPVAGFRSEGLDEVVAWLTKQVREVKRAKDTVDKAAQSAERQTSAKASITQSRPPHLPSSTVTDTPIPSLAHRRWFWILFVQGVQAFIVLCLALSGEAKPESLAFLFIFVLILSGMQWALLAPVVRPTIRPGTPKAFWLWVSGGAAGLLVGTLAAGVIAILSDLLWLANSSSVYGTPLSPFVVIAFFGCWIMSTLMITTFMKSGHREKKLCQIAASLFAGTIIEAIATIPVIALVEKREKCVCGTLSFMALFCSMFVGMIVFGPAILLVIFWRRSRAGNRGLCAACGHDLKGLGNLDKCPRCGVGWKPQVIAVVR